jgi:hypothetical protein
MKSKITKSKITKSKITFVILAIFIFSLNSHCQLLGIYEFSGSGACPNQNNTVTTPPDHAHFSNFDSHATICSAASDVFNSRSWNTSNEIDLSQYHEFSLTADSCYDLTVSSLSFIHRASNNSTVPSWHVRSNVDDFLEDIATGVSSINNETSVIELPALFTHLTHVTFRIYVTSIYATTTTWRNDNVALFGSINSIPVKRYFIDSDQDGFGDTLREVFACSLPSKCVEIGGDCDDTDSQLHPNTKWYSDVDGDTFGDSVSYILSCEAPPNYVRNNSDCDDSTASITSHRTTFYRDEDQDGFGDSSVFRLACSPPEGYVTNDQDCDDSDSTITLATKVFYKDLDGDGYGDPQDSILACTQIPHYSENADDCDDGDSMITVATQRYYQDLDGDGFGTSEVSIISCSQPLGYTLDFSDCNDADSLIHPNAVEIEGNDIDENCDDIVGQLGMLNLSMSSLNLYPNPTTGILYLDADIFSSVYGIKILDSHGNVLSHCPVSTILDVSNYPKGMYMLQILSSENVFFTPFFVVD